MRRVHASFSVLVFGALAAMSCARTPQPLGEALVVVQTDVDVPRRVNHVTIDVLGEGGVLVDAREIVTPSRDDWPVSFSVVLPDGAPASDVTVRIRAYPEGHTLSARDIQRFAEEQPRDVKVYASIDDACKNAPTLQLGQPLTLRRGSTAITSLLQTAACQVATKSGSVVAQLVIAEQGDYTIAITHGTPDSANAEPGSDTSLSLRTSCAFPSTQLACAIPAPGIDHLSKIDRVTLSPGTYWVVTGGLDAAPADLTLLALQLDVVAPAPTTPAPAETADAVALEPEPGVTIDRLLTVHLTPGQRGSVPVTLRGECFGTAPDLAGGKTCVDTAGALVPLVAQPAVGPLDRRLATPVPWPGDVPVPCTAAARPDEICVPGGAFILGDTLALQDLDRRSQPERVRVVDAFLMDKMEMSVAKFREALAHGFVAPDATPLLNPETTLTSGKPAGVCTYSAAPVGREEFPLTCTSWVTASALCKFLGGDLPTEDQWELAATAAGRDTETPYPWGTALPTCDRTVFGRTALATAACPTAPLGPIAVNDPALVAGDVTPLGIVGLGGNVEELLSTPFVRYSDPEWTAAGLRGQLIEAEAPMRSARGADWSVGSLFATASTRRSEPVVAAYDNVGFRCVRSGK